MALTPKQRLFRANDRQHTLYFPDTAVIALLGQVDEGQTLDVALIGRDGMVGIGVVPGVTIRPCDAVVQVGGVARMISTDILRNDVALDEPLHQLVGRYAHLLLARSIQTAVCNTFHSVEQRCARWLLTAHDLVDGDELVLTQAFLAAATGVRRRPTVTSVVGTLQRMGLIAVRRGRLIVKDRPGLESAACECYALMRLDHYRLLGF